MASVVPLRPRALRPEFEPVGSLLQQASAPYPSRPAASGVLGRRRSATYSPCSDGVVDDFVARRTQTRLDIEEQRLTGVEPLD